MSGVGPLSSFVPLQLWINEASLYIFDIMKFWKCTRSVNVPCSTANREVLFRNSKIGYFISINLFCPHSDRIEFFVHDVSHILLWLLQGHWLYIYCKPSFNYVILPKLRIFPSLKTIELEWLLIIFKRQYVVLCWGVIPRCEPFLIKTVYQNSLSASPTYSHRGSTQGGSLLTNADGRF